MIDEPLYAGIRWIHIVAGTTALFAAPVAMMVAKGGKWHRLLGKVFFFGMAMICLTSVFMALLKPDRLWLGLLGVFSFHLAASGYRSLYLKKLHEGLKPAAVDLWLHGVAGLINGGLLIWGVAHLFMKVQDLRSILYAVFGAIGMFFVITNITRFYKRKHDKREWFFGHITGMLGGYIATVSAFSAVNFGTWFPWMPAWLVWLWPTLIGAPMIALWSAFYRRKFAKGAKVRELAEVRIR